MTRKINNPNKKQKQKKHIETKRQEIAHIYGLSLADIEHVVLENGKEIFKFYNPKDRSIKMIENRDYGSNMSESFKNIQQELTFTQSENAKENAEQIYNHNSDYKQVELSLVSVTELKGNKYQYIRQINSLSTIDRKRLMALLKSADEIDLAYINITNAIGVDSKNQVIDVDYDYQNNHAVIKKAKVLSYQDNKQMVTEDNLVMEVTDAELDTVIRQVDIADDIPTITESQELMIAGEKINTQKAVELYNTPELIERSNLNDKQKAIYTRIIEKIKLKIKNNNTKNTKKIRTLTKHNNNHYAA